jgi:CheY-like chemotaxis protein
VEKKLPSAGLIRRAIIIDHDPTYSLFLSRLIAGLGHEVVEISGPRASDLSELKVNDVVFLDVMFPRGGGLEALKIIARQSSNCSIVLMCGANDHPHDAEVLPDDSRVKEGRQVTQFQTLRLTQSVQDLCESEREIRSMDQ